MNEITKGQIGALAFNVAMEKAQSGAPPMSKAEFDGLCETVLAEIERAVEAVLSGKVGAEEEKAKFARKARKATGEAGGKGVDGEALFHFLNTAGKSTLQEIAERFAVSKGVAERALAALGDKVKSEKGINPPGKRGKAPTVYFLAE